MYKERRIKFLESLPNNSITVLMAGCAPYSIGDEKYPFKVDRSFYYFTGLNNENLVLMFVKVDENYQQEILFVEHFDERLAKWVGGRIKPAEASEIAEIYDVRYVDEVESSIGSILNAYGKLNSFTLCGDLSKQEFSQNNETVNLFNKVTSLYPSCKILNVFDKICYLRMSKDETEIELMKKAIAITKEGISTMMSYSHPYVWENELEAYFDFVLKCNQADHAFSTICAAGKNATILHYGKNNTRSGAEDLVLCDLGAAHQLYNTDITRTFPVSGKFTERQKVIYDIVLRGNKLVRSLARPGLTLRDLNNELIKFYQVELANIGLLENGKTVRDYYWHSVSHMLGLETHDISLPNLVLTPGCVITNEPGLYLEEEGIGIRIEDDLLITEDGCEELSSEIIKEIDEIEAFMAKN